MTIIDVPRRCCVPVRAIIWIMLFTCTLFLYMLRTNISIIILAMVDTGKNASSMAIPECNKNDSIIAEKQTVRSSRHGTTYDWSSELQGHILGGYFWGFVISNIPAAAVAEKYGPRRSVAIGVGISTVLTLVAPWCAAIHPYMLIASRFFIGLFTGIVYPGVHCLISKWSPPAEKGRFISSTLGGSMGTVITWPFLGNILEHLDWKWAFYISGFAVLLWLILWMVLVYDSPEQHPWIGEEERSYIVSSLSGTVSNKTRIPPYKAIALSVPALSLCVAQFGNLWGLFFLMTAGPKFMSSVLGFDIGHTGFLAALPYLARMFSGFAFGAIGDAIVKKDLLTKTKVRKYFIVFSHIVPGLFLITQTFVGCRVNWVVAFITLSLASNGASTITHLSNAQDLAPNFAGSLYGISNSIGSTTGFISPMVVGYLTAEHNGLKEWHIIFYIGATVYIACGIFFALFSSGEIQPWNYAEEAEGVDNVAFDAKEGRA